MSGNVNFFLVLDNLGSIGPPPNLRQLGENIGQLFERFRDNFDTIFGQHGDYLVELTSVLWGACGHF